MDYDASLRWLQTLPDFERTGRFSARPDVAPMHALLDALGDPHLGRPTIHVAGSKGKGSTAIMAEAILRAAGRRTGCYISPHLHRFNERIRVDAQPVAQEAFAAAMTAVRDAIDAVAPRFPDREFVAFDALTAAAFVAFRDAGADVQVVEVGLGGLLDSTNVFGSPRSAGFQPAPAHDAPSADLPSPCLGEGPGVRACPTSNLQRPTSTSGEGPGVRVPPAPHVSVVTSISLEHTAVLGATIPEIAAQKAGIIIDGDTVVVAPMRESALDVVRAHAAGRHARAVEVAAVCQLARSSANADGQDFKLKTPHATYAAHLPLIGRHQLDNLATAVLACEELCAQAGVELTPAHVRAALADVKWPARLEALKRRPLLVVDGAHNADSAKRMVAALREHLGITDTRGGRPAIVLCGTLADKDVAGMAAAVASIAAEAIVAPWPSARAAEPAAVAQAFRDAEIPVAIFPSLPAAVDAALAEAGPSGAVVAFGAISFAAAVREYLLGIQSDIIRLRSGAAAGGPDERPR